MGTEDDCKKIGLIESFVRDKNRLEKVVAIAERLLRWNEDGSSCSYGESERAVTAECIVHELVADALCGTRKWNIKEMPEFDGWIITQLKSKKWNLVRELLRPLPSKERLTTKRLPTIRTKIISDRLFLYKRRSRKMGLIRPAIMTTSEITRMMNLSRF